MKLCVVVLPSFGFWFLCGYLCCVIRVGEIHRREDYCNSRSPLSEPDNMCGGSPNLFKMSGRYTGEREFIHPFSPLLLFDFMLFLVCIWCRGDYTGEEIIVILVLPFMNQFIAFLMTPILTTFLTPFCGHQFCHDYRLWCGIHSGQGPILCIYIV